MSRFRTLYIFAVVITVALSALAQQPEPERRDDKYKADAHAYCRKGPNDADEPSAHSCNCAFMCSEPEADGTPGHQMESSACELYCSAITKAGQRGRCACHPDVTCAPDPFA